MKKVWKPLSIVNNFIPLIHPANRFLLIWAFIHLICILFAFITIPFILSFEPEISKWYKYCHIICYSVFLMDLLIAFKTGIYENGVALMSPTKI